MSIVFLDTETTALLAVEAAALEHQPYIVEIYCLKTNDNLEPYQEYWTYVKPPITIPDEVIKIHGVTNEAASTFHPFAGYYQSLAKFFLGVTHMIAHNVQYDKRMLVYELQRCNKQFNFPWPPKDICTIEEIVKIKGHRMNLTDLHTELFGEGFAHAHSAKEDTKALSRVYKEMVSRRMVKGPVV